MRITRMTTRPAAAYATRIPGPACWMAAPEPTKRPAPMTPAMAIMDRCLGFRDLESCWSACMEVPSCWEIAEVGRRALVHHGGPCDAPHRRFTLGPPLCALLCALQQIWLHPTGRHSKQKPPQANN